MRVYMWEIPCLLSSWHSSGYFLNFAGKGVCCRYSNAGNFKLSSCSTGKALSVLFLQLPLTLRGSSLGSVFRHSPCSPPHTHRWSAASAHPHCRTSWSISASPQAVGPLAQRGCAAWVPSPVQNPHVAEAQRTL